MMIQFIIGDVGFIWATLYITPNMTKPLDFSLVDHKPGMPNTMHLEKPKRKLYIIKIWKNTCAKYKS
jgi:hypothetical protein